MQKLSFTTIAMLGMLTITNPSIVNADNLAKTCASTPKTVEYNQALKWYRNSAERNALYRQTYAIASYYVDDMVKQQNPTTWGVILDIDETTLDNSFYYKECSNSVDNEDDFSQYVALKKQSTALPGVKQFTCRVRKMGGYVTMLSNRDGSYPGVLQATIDNLKHQGICFDQVILANRKMASNPSDKNPRFMAVTNGNCDAKQMVCSNKLPAHQVIAYFGDNIQDFPKLKQHDAIKFDPNGNELNIFGNGYFMLPNPLYGSWQANPLN